jgi:cell division septation protein DedD
MLAAPLVLALPGCGSSGESVDNQREAPPQEQLSPPKEEPAKKLGFETRIDTVTAVHGNEHKGPQVQGHDIQIRFTVQIGAFKDPHNASTVQSKARKRFRLPVLNDYLSGAGLYQIRIGFFESRAGAHAFRQQMIQEYPDDYKDAWVVQLKR